MSRILIVEDESDTQQMLGTFLSGQGYDVAFANNGWEALLALGDWPFDLILLDIMMPGLDGAKFLQILRRASKAGQTPVLIVTALDRGEAEDRVRGQSHQGIIVKRDKLFEQLLQRVEAIVGKPPRDTMRGGGSMN